MPFPPIFPMLYYSRNMERKTLKDKISAGLENLMVRGLVEVIYRLDTMPDSWLGPVQDLNIWLEHCYDTFKDYLPCKSKKR